MTFSDKRLNVLIVEDNSGDALLIQEYLQEETNSLYHHVRTFSDAETFLNSGLKAEVILLDLTLPDMGGEELVNRMLKIAGEIPIIVLTGYSNKSFSIKTLKLGISDYLLKDELTPDNLYKSILYSIERKQISNDLKKSEEKYRNLFHLSPLPMWVYDPDTLAFLDVNEAACKKYEYTPEEFLQMTIKDIRPPEEVWKLMETLKRGSSLSSFEDVHNHCKKDGTLMYVNIQSNLIYFAGKKARLTVSTEVTEKIKAEKALQKQEALFRAIIEKGSDMKTLIKPDGTIIFGTPSITRILGYAPDEYIGKNEKDFVHPLEVENLFAKIQQSIGGEKTSNIELRVRAKNGEYRWCEKVITNLLNDPDVNAIVCDFRDITEKKKADLLIKESNNRYDLVSKATSDAIWDYNFSTDRTFIAGTGYKQLFGYDIVNRYTEDEFWESKLHPDDREEVLNKLRDFIKDKNLSQYSYEYRFLKADGTYAYVHDRLFIIRDNEIPVRLIGAINDITRKKEEELHLKLLESVITNATDAVMVTEACPNNSEWPKIIYVNEAFTKMSGYEKEEIVGRTPDVLIGTRTSRLGLTKLKRAVDNTQPCSVEIINYAKTQKPYWVGIDLAPVTNTNGKISHLITIQRDISSRKLQEQEREKLIFQLIQNNKDLKQFSYITSHNLRGPIANLLGLSNLIENYKVDDPELKKILNGIKTATHRFDETIKDLSLVLNVRDSLSIPREQLNLSKVYEKAYMQCETDIIECRASVFTDFSKAPLVYFNKAYLESILLNLLTNSIKYRSSERKLQVFITTERNSANEIVMKFRDNGLGLNLKLHQEKLFRLHQRFHDNIEGKGLGLFLVKTQMEAMNGAIQVESEVDQGTLFTLKFREYHK
jgi:PAS domain S-box-containing protein